MSIIQTIRDKAAVLVFGIIALSLIGFLVQDAFVGGGSPLFNDNSNTVGSINGKEIKRQDFDEKVEAMQAQYQSQGMMISNAMRNSLYEQAWSGYVNRELLQQEADRLGIKFTQKELGNLLLSEDAPPQFKREFTDPNTGIYDIDKVRNFIRSFQKSKDQQQVKLINDQIIEPMQLGALSDKFTSLFKQGIYFPKWLVEKENTDNSLVADVSFISMNYASVPDSTVKVTDQEIEEYVSNHKDQFKQKRSRTIAYVVFDGSPTSSDSAAIFNRLNNLRTEFAAATNVTGFVTRNASKAPFQDNFEKKEGLSQELIKDSSVSLVPGMIVGPYLENNTYTIARVVDVKNLPDSARARHILIATNNPQNGQPILEDSIGKNRADSIAAAIAAGASFDSLNLQYSNDDVSKAKGGVLDYFSKAQMVGAFSKYSFENPVGSKGVVKSEFGYHYIEILDQKGFHPEYKVAYLTREIVPSEETDNKASGDATQFSANSRSAKAFQSNADKQKLNIRVSEQLTEAASDVSGLGVSRPLVRWVFENDLSDVSEPFTVGDLYVVATVTKENKEGVQNAATARPFVETIIRNRKKSVALGNQFGKYNSIEEVAKKMSQDVQRADSVKFSNNFHPALGAELRVLGAAFNKNNQAKASGPIAGNNGLYALQVRSIGALSNTNSSPEMQRKAMLEDMKRQVNMTLFQAMQEEADIKDERLKAGY